MSYKKKRFKAYLLKLLTRKRHTHLDPGKVKKVLILKYDRIGDMVATTPIFRELKLAFPDVQISVLASQTNKDIIKYNPYVESIYTNYKNNILGDLYTLLKLLRKKFDVCIELEHSVIPHAIIRLKIIKPKKVVSIYKDGRYGVKGSELALYDFYTKKSKSKHFADIWLETLSFFQLKGLSNKYDIFLSDKENDRAKKFIGKYKKNIKIGINLKGSFKEKQIYPDKLYSICKKIYAHDDNVQIIILNAQSDSVRINNLVSKMNFKFIVPAYPTENILHAAALIRQFDLIITPDTSITHIASAFDVPIVTIHENNNDSYRLWKPLSTLNRTIFAKNKYGIENFSVDDVVNASLSLLESIGKSNRK